MVVEKDIDGTIYKIRDDLTLGELSKIQDSSTEVDETGRAILKISKMRAQIISISILEPKISPEEAAKMKAVVGLKLYLAIQAVNGVAF